MLWLAAQLGLNGPSKCSSRSCVHLDHMLLLVAHRSTAYGVIKVISSSFSPLPPLFFFFFFAVEHLQLDEQTPTNSLATSLGSLCSFKGLQSKLSLLF